MQLVSPYPSLLSNVGADGYASNLRLRKQPVDNPYPITHFEMGYHQ